MTQNNSNGLVCLITGASSGIGWELARQLGDQGYALGLMARRESELKSLRQSLSSTKVPVEYAVCDVSDRQQVLDAVKALSEKLGPCDLLIANAGISYPVPAKSFASERIKEIMDVNFFGTVNVIDAVLPKMLERKSGHIVGISSVASFVTFPASFPYSASKTAVNKLLDGLRLELKPLGIHVTRICPGFIRTPLTDENKMPMPFLMDVNKACRMMVRAIQSKRTAFTFPWQMAVIAYIVNMLPTGISDWLILKSGFKKKH